MPSYIIGALLLPLFILIIIGIMTLILSAKVNEIKSLIKQFESADAKRRAEIIAALAYKHEHKQLQFDVVKPLITALKYEKAPIRSGAAEALGLLDDSQAIKPLIRALKDKDMLVRREAITALGLLKASQATSPLLEMLKEQDRESLCRVLEALGKIANPRAIDAVIETLEHQDAAVRKTAVEILGELTRKSQRLIPLFVRRLEDRHPDVRISAVGALVNMHWQPETNQEQIAYAIAKREWDSPVLTNAEAVEILLNMLADERPENLNTRVNAAIVLGRSGEERAVKPLLKMLEDPNANIRQIAVAALGDIGTVKILQPLANALQDESPEVRMTAATALGQIGDEQATAALIQKVGATQQRDKNPEVRKKIVEALGKIGNPRAIVMLTWVMGEDDDADVRLQTADVLLSKGWNPQQDAEQIACLIAKGDWDKLLGFRAQAVTPLVKMTKDRNRDVREHATKALTKILASITVVIFGDVKFKRIKPSEALYNFDTAELTVPFSTLRRIIIHTPTYDFHLVERFLTYAINYIGQQYLKQTVNVLIVGDPDKLHPNLRNNLQNLCKQVEVHLQNLEGLDANNL